MIGDVNSRLPRFCAIQRKGRSLPLQWTAAIDIGARPEVSYKHDDEGRSIARNGNSPRRK